MKFHKKKYKSKEKQASEISHTTLPRLKSRVRIPSPAPKTAIFSISNS